MYVVTEYVGAPYAPYQEEVKTKKQAQKLMAQWVKEYHSSNKGMAYKREGTVKSGSVIFRHAIYASAIFSIEKQ